jgi:hypothetical protein
MLRQTYKELSSLVLLGPFTYLLGCVRAHVCYVFHVTLAMLTEGACCCCASVCLRDRSCKHSMHNDAGCSPCLYSSFPVEMLHIC